MPLLSCSSVSQAIACNGTTCLRKLATIIQFCRTVTDGRQSHSNSMRLRQSTCALTEALAGMSRTVTSMGLKRATAADVMSFCLGQTTAITVVTHQHF